MAGKIGESLQQRIGKTEKYYADIERGYCGMSLETMIEISWHTGFSLDYLIYGKYDDQGINENTRRILFCLGQCGELQQKKAIELLQVFLEK